MSPATSSVTPKSPRDFANASISAATMPRAASGRRIVKKARSGLAPSVRAARTSVTSTASSAGRENFTTIGSAPTVAAQMAPVLVNTMGEPVIFSNACPMKLRRPSATSR